MVGQLEPLAGDKGDELDEMIRALADKRRRYVLYDLSVHGGFAALADLAERLADWLGLEDRRVIRVGLVHNHLPTLDRLDLVEFDREAHTVSLTKKGELANDSRGAYLEQFLAKCG